MLPFGLSQWYFHNDIALFFSLHSPALEYVAACMVRSVSTRSDTERVQIWGVRRAYPRYRWYEQPLFNLTRL